MLVKPFSILFFPSPNPLYIYYKYLYIYIAFLLFIIYFLIFKSLNKNNGYKKHIYISCIIIWAHIARGFVIAVAVSKFEYIQYHFSKVKYTFHTFVLFLSSTNVSTRLPLVKMSPNNILYPKGCILRKKKNLEAK